ncbi:MAG: hypothetical protein IKO49_02270 [Bacilli bacterium]|nr:hypothetical protein [Clostridia bacterium]MBR4618107.1 hypothetical protein [Bacilli bacterium]
MSNIWCFLKKYVWCFPALIMFIGILYYINLFERMYARDLERQMNEKFQIVNVLEALHTYDGLHIAVNAFDNFDDTNIYILRKNLETGQLEERYHSNNCKFKLQQHPFENEEIRHQLISHEKGSFAFGEDRNHKILWDYRWVNVDNKNYLIIMSITNYPLDAIDREFQISIGLLLLVTALLNWSLVGYGKYLRSGYCKIKSKKNKSK